MSVRSHLSVSIPCLANASRELGAENRRHSEELAVAFKLLKGTLHHSRQVEAHLPCSSKHGNISAARTQSLDHTFIRPTGPLVQVFKVLGRFRGGHVLVRQIVCSKRRCRYARQRNMRPRNPRRQRQAPNAECDSHRQGRCDFRDRAVQAPAPAYPAP